MKINYVVSCEHASNSVPKIYQSLFAKWRAKLQSHFGYDKGAVQLATMLAKQLRCPLVAAKYSRLLIDLNRSLHHQQLFSNFTKPLPSLEKKAIIQTHYLPYRRQIEEYIQEKNQNGDCVVHISIHSFTPTLNNQKRQTDIGLLYDPRRSRERQICRHIKTTLNDSFPQLRVRRNYPYLGTADGLTVYFRKQFTDSQYAGIEIEFNQALIAKKLWKSLNHKILKKLSSIL